MSIFLSCDWYPPTGVDIQARFGHIAPLLEREEMVAVVGRTWYRTGRSKRDALSRPLSLAKLVEARSWSRGRIVDDETGLEKLDYSLGAWNGRDDPDGVSLHVMLHDPPNTMDSLSIDGLGLESVKDKWPNVLAWGEVVARHLGGLCHVSSHELIEWAEAEGLEGAIWAAYAMFEGRGRRSMVSSPTWQEVVAPKKERVLAVSEAIQVEFDSLEKNLKRPS